MKICPGCGNATIDLMKKCPKCGATLDSDMKVSFLEASKIQAHNLQQEKQDERENLKRMDREGIAYCPKCHSTSLSANKKGFGIGKAVVGAALATNPIGLVAGNIGAKKVRVTCLKCGHQFWPGKK